MRRLRLGMVGGGHGAFIGAVHRYAARLDGEWELVAGALSSDPKRAAASASGLGIVPERSYADFRYMAQAEAMREDGIDAVAIVTPNHMHAGPAVAFLDAGIHVICDKPLAATAEDADAIADAVMRSGRHFVLTHNYTGYPMIRQAREMVANGDLGALRVVQVEYAQDWLTETLSTKQADWRTDPERSGAGGCVGDIGTHAFNLATFVTGAAPESLSAELNTFVAGRRVDDDVQVRLRYKTGARGSLWASQVAVGNENGLRLRVYGDRAGIEWSQETPNSLAFTVFGEPRRILTRAGAGVTSSANVTARTPAGHPEGYLEAFATIYSDAAKLIRAGASNGTRQVPIPSIEDGLAGMRFIASCLRSSMGNGVWVDLGSAAR
ncbi:Gfo/Idh/MocA family protein [Oricola cellulosilytica]|uniref:Gfo/Idh/MocA family oxidoreductase n=1 Tax=Oricola cellulosilytica TaxID=1429082 RepID=A0A4R0P8G0_9HYPH|nr:Gfo/Idh/MocA family oxidoreductase [Oricola cellulosilytica]TCD13352.1 Gfo/Idh/MocA family oxidoreductase [Oricola cellulosilytica]